MSFPISNLSFFIFFLAQMFYHLATYVLTNIHTFEKGRVSSQVHTRPVNSLRFHFFIFNIISTKATRI